MAEEAEDPLPRPVTVHGILLDVLTKDIVYMVNAKLYLKFFLFSKIFDQGQAEGVNYKFVKHASNLMLNYTIMSINMIKLLQSDITP